MGNDERTFIMIKPDGVQRGLMGDIIKRFEQKGFKLVAMKFMQVSAQTSYFDLTTNQLLGYFTESAKTGLKAVEIHMLKVRYLVGQKLILQGG